MSSYSCSNGSCVNSLTREVIPEDEVDYRQDSFMGMIEEAYKELDYTANQKAITDNRIEPQYQQGNMEYVTNALGERVPAPGQSLADTGIGMAKGLADMGESITSLFGLAPNPASRGLQDASQYLANSVDNPGAATVGEAITDEIIPSLAGGVVASKPIRAFGEWGVETLNDFNKFRNKMKLRNASGKIEIPDKILSPAERQANLDNWLGEGKLHEVYRGGPRDYAYFDPELNTGSKYGVWGNYTSNLPSEASMYADRGLNPSMQKLFIREDNFADMRKGVPQSVLDNLNITGNTSEVRGTLLNAIVNQNEKFKSPTGIRNAITNAYKKAGYSGLRDETQIIPFDATDIKSVNSQFFNPNDPRLMYGIGGLGLLNTYQGDSNE